MGRYLGQHFLVNKNKIKRIVEALELKSGDTIIEIGPGHGELTTELINKFKNLKVKKFKIVAIEKDKKLAGYLKEKFKNDKNVEIIEGDALKLLTQLTNDLLLTTNDYKITGNIPYYITGYLFRILGELENKPSLIVLTIQKEVAERICAKIQTRRRQGYGGQGMNLLAASVQFWAEPEIIDYISKRDFRPIPEVDSAIIKLKVKSGKRQPKREKYYQFIKILFKQPRKTIVNNVSEFQSLKVSKGEIIKKLKKININPQARPQELSFEQIIELSTLF